MLIFYYIITVNKCFTMLIYSRKIFSENETLLSLSNYFPSWEMCTLAGPLAYSLRYVINVLFLLWKYKKIGFYHAFKRMLSREIQNAFKRNSENINERTNSEMTTVNIFIRVYVKWIYFSQVWDDTVCTGSFVIYYLHLNIILQNYWYVFLWYLMKFSYAYNKKSHYTNSLC